MTFRDHAEGEAGPVPAVSRCASIEAAERAVILASTVIRTEYVYPPIPIREFDWSAVPDDCDEGSPIGWGRTEQAAISDLLDQLQDRC